MVKGQPRHSESNGGVERFNRTIEDKIAKWMAEHKSLRWSVGGKICCWRYNTQMHRAIGGLNPYRITFGQQARCGISHLPLSHALIESLRVEGELVSLCNQLDNDGEVGTDEVVGNDEEVEPTKRLEPTKSHMM
jgi:hypothetical protein